MGDVRNERILGDLKLGRHKLILGWPFFEEGSRGGTLTLRLTSGLGNLVVLLRVGFDVARHAVMRPQTRAVILEDSSTRGRMAARNGCAGHQRRVRGSLS